MTDGFSLSSRLAADAAPVGDLPLSSVLLMRDSRFPWLVLVPRRPNIREIMELAAEDAHALTEEILAASRVLTALYHPDKLNVAALGNLVPQLHVHVIARFTSDSAWPKPVWGSGEPVPYDAATLERRLDAVRQALRLA